MKIVILLILCMIFVSSTVWIIIYLTVKYWNKKQKSYANRTQNKTKHDQL